MARVLQRSIPLVVLAILVAIAPTMQANPGGEGDGTRDFTCGGSCHGDPGLSQPSSADIEVNLDRIETYAGGPLTVTAKVTGMELAGQRLVGVFLLSSLHGVDDNPESHGWSILADGSGGLSNYVEHRAFDAEEGVEVTWTLRAPAAEGTHSFHIAAHHGGGGAARLAHTDTPLNVTVGPVPENLPQMSASWEPLTTRGLGSETPLDLPAVNATTVSVEWRLTGGSTQTVSAIGTDGSWTAILPAAIGPSSIYYRVLLVNDEFSEATPWIELEAVSPGFMPDLNAVRLQMCSLMFATAALAIALTRRLSRAAGDGKARLAESIVPMSSTELGQVQPAPAIEGAPISALGSNSAAAVMATTPATPSIGGLAMDDPRRPPGWTDEQWQHYGPGMITQQGGGA